MMQLVALPTSCKSKNVFKSGISTAFIYFSFMSFTLVIPKNTRVAEDKTKATSLATTAGVIYQNSVTTGALEAAGASTVQAQVLWRANESITAGEALAKVHALRIDLGDVFLADTANNSNSAHNGQRMVLSAGGATINNTGTDSATGLFQQLDVVGAAADKKILAARV